MQPGVLATLMNISQKVLIDCSGGAVKPNDIALDSKPESTFSAIFEANDLDSKTTDRNKPLLCPVTASSCSSVLDATILKDWLLEAVHQLTRATANNTVRVAADNLLVTLTSRHGCFDEVTLLILLNFYFHLTYTCYQCISK